MIFLVGIQGNITFRAVPVYINREIDYFTRTADSFDSGIDIFYDYRFAGEYKNSFNTYTRGRLRLTSNNGVSVSADNQYNKDVHFKSSGKVVTTYFATHPQWRGNSDISRDGGKAYCNIMPGGIFYYFHSKLNGVDEHNIVPIFEDGVCKLFDTVLDDYVEFESTEDLIPIFEMPN